MLWSSQTYYGISINKSIFLCVECVHVKKYESAYLPCKCDIKCMYCTKPTLLFVYNIVNRKYLKKLQFIKSCKSYDFTYWLAILLNHTLCVT